VFTRKRSGGGLTWYIQYYYRGVVEREKVGRDTDGVTKTLAKKALATREGDIAKDKFDLARIKKYPIFSKLMDKYLEWSETHKRSFKRDLSTYKHLKPFFGKVRIDDITPFMIERYKSKRKKEIQAMKKNRGKDDRDISFASINRELALLKHFYTMAIKWHKIDKNPVLGIKMFPEKKRGRYLTEYEIERLLKACEKSKNPMLKNIVITALNTGGRLREVLYLKVKDIDFNIPMIYFEHTKNGGRGEVPMNDYLKDTLREHLKDHQHEYLFCNVDGRPFDRITVSFKNALKVAGIKDFRFHDLRHTFASQLAMNGIEGRTLQELGRWKSPEMASRYIHLSPLHKMNAINTIGVLFKNKHETSTKVILGDFSGNS
jgi:integrase